MLQTIKLVQFEAFRYIRIQGLEGVFMDASQAAKFLGRLGGSVRSKAKTKSSRANGQLGGRPRKYSACPRYNNKSHRFAKSGRCACGYRKP